jgi:tRNA(Ile)-lysidine synthase TilS/MesJ
MEEEGTETLLTAHHADDQAETLLLHLIRGTGPDGAQAMPMSQPFRLPGMTDFVTLIRPLLRERRSVLESLVTKYEILPVSDPTNSDTLYRRNAIRHRVIPVLEELNPGAVGHLANFAELMAEDNATFIPALINAMLGVPGDGSLDLDCLADLDNSMVRRVLRAWILNQTGIVLTFDRTQALVELAKRGKGGAIIEIGEGRTVERTGRTLNIRPAIEPTHGGISES